MEACHVAEHCQTVGLFLFNNEFDKNNIGLYRDRRLTIFKNVKGHRVDKIRKEFYQFFKGKN